MQHNSYDASQNTPILDQMCFLQPFQNSAISFPLNFCFFRRKPFFKTFKEFVHSNRETEKDWMVKCILCDKNFNQHLHKCHEHVEKYHFLGVYEHHCSVCERRYNNYTTIARQKPCHGKVKFLIGSTLMRQGGVVLVISSNHLRIRWIFLDHLQSQSNLKNLKNSEKFGKNIIQVV